MYTRFIAAQSFLLSQLYPVWHSCFRLWSWWRRSYAAQVRIDFSRFGLVQYMVGILLLVPWVLVPGKQTQLTFCFHQTSVACGCSRSAGTARYYSTGCTCISILTLLPCMVLVPGRSVFLYTSQYGALCKCESLRIKTPNTVQHWCWVIIHFLSKSLHVSKRNPPFPLNTECHCCIRSR